VEDADAGGAASITIHDLDALDADIASRGIEPAGPVTYTNGGAQSDPSRRGRQRDRLRR
jgi:hypothetical protein